MRRSRRANRAEKQSKKTLFLSILGILIIFAVIFKFGIPLLIGFSTIISGSNNSETSQKESISFVSSPFLDAVVDATNSADLKIKGEASSKIKVELYLNGGLEESDTSDAKGDFSFSIKLIEGSNTIKARAVKDDKKSSFSKEQTIYYVKGAPQLVIDYPADGEKFSKEKKVITVSGHTNIICEVTVNGFMAATDDENNFSYNLPLKEGDNEIKVIAVDDAGNSSEKTIKIRTE